MKKALCGSYFNMLQPDKPGNDSSAVNEMLTS